MAITFHFATDIVTRTPSLWHTQLELGTAVQRETKIAAKSPNYLVRKVWRYCEAQTAHRGSGPPLRQLDEGQGLPERAKIVRDDHTLAFANLFRFLR